MLDGILEALMGVVSYVLGERELMHLGIIALVGVIAGAVAGRFMVAIFGAESGIVRVVLAILLPLGVFAAGYGLAAGDGVARFNLPIAAEVGGLISGGVLGVLVAYIVSPWILLMKRVIGFVTIVLSLAAGAFGCYSAMVVIDVVSQTAEIIEEREER